MYLLTRTLMILTFFLVLLPLQSEIHANDDAIARGIELYEAGNLKEAREFFETFVKAYPENAEGYYYLGRTLFDENHFKDAEKQLEKAVKLESNNSYYHLWLGRASGRRAQSASIFKKPGLAKKTKKHFEIAVQLDDNNVEAKEDLIAYYTQAPGIMGGSTEKAKVLAERLLEQDKLRGYRSLWQIYEKEKKYDQVENFYKKAALEFPDNLSVRFGLGYFYQRRKQYAKAFEVFEQMVQDSSDNFSALYQIGRTGVLSGQNLDRAEECFKIYLQQEPRKNMPSLAAAHWRLGMVYEHKHQKDLARKEYQAALKLDPEFKAAKKALKKLK